MRTSHFRLLSTIRTLALSAVVLGSPCAAVAQAPARLPVSKADVEFMSGMIPHHAQAVLIASWKAT